jgi:triacylglycerol lipase
MNIVLASGFLIPQHFLGHDYFRDVQAHLEQQSHKVLPPLVPPLGHCEDRAKILADNIAGKFGNDPVHIIAHSMGGLDSRMMIGRNFRDLGHPGRILSLTTLSTPHRGSPVADLVAGGGPDGLRAKFLDMVGRLGVDTGALRDLTSEAARTTIPDVAATHPHIRIRSYAASGRMPGRQTCAVLKPTYDYVKAKTGEDNDGVVTVSSAKYGEFQEPAWPCDHIQEMGYDLDTVLVPSVLTRIGQTALGALGFASPPFDHFTKIDMIVGQFAQDG